MRLTKYPQSCILLEKDGGGRLLLDAGTFLFDSYELDDLGGVDAVVYTHQHPDHFAADRVAGFLERGAEVYGNADVCEQVTEAVGRDAATEVRDGEAFEAAGFRLTPHDIPHVELVDGSPGPPNTGFLVDDQLLHPGDGMRPPQLQVDNVAIPIVGPSISFRDAYVFLEQVGARRAVPMHYDFFIADPDQFAGFCDIADVVVLDHGESTTW